MVVDSHNFDLYQFGLDFSVYLYFSRALAVLKGIDHPISLQCLSSVVYQINSCASLKAASLRIHTQFGSCAKSETELALL